MPVGHQEVTPVVYDSVYGVPQPFQYEYSPGQFGLLCACGVYFCEKSESVIGVWENWLDYGKLKKIKVIVGIQRCHFHFFFVPQLWIHVQMPSYMLNGHHIRPDGQCDLKHMSTINFLHSEFRLHLGYLEFWCEKNLFTLKGTLQPVDPSIMQKCIPKYYVCHSIKCPS